MAILVVTNRNINDPSQTDEGLFGEQVNANGPSEIRLAWAEYRGGRWHLELIPEPDLLTEQNRPSRLVFEACRESLLDSGRDCVFYVHGFNKQFRETLEQAKAIHDRYRVATVVFSWPSNPGGFIIDEYRQAQAIARNSTVAFDRTMQLLSSYIREGFPDECGISLNMITHSLGNYLLEDFILDPIFSGQTRIFDNIVLHQADVDVETHIDWVQEMRYSRRVYVTFNEWDGILKYSDIINPDRLGNTVPRPPAARPVYFDFSRAENIGTIHQLFEAGARVNDNVAGLFSRALHGHTAEQGDGIHYDEEHGLFRVS
jgi:hypothetical protein